ncbi:DUF6340 family protein [Hymenobacter glacialis]|uniref:Tetratricopeptide repeat protein n=1 Tax=Hymenobacter glacialis TaxID=1908236 RepID=A0A1G1SZ07_9BACT|nr:DUF6340 family protein [Hymenobacter glacialis]OGX83862.1 hypothetical protein BEN48_03615 [Hymenobacter glacialis]
MKPFLRSAFLVASALLSACTSTIHMQALAPAAVRMPDELQRIATANRIVPTSGRDKFFDVLEGVFTGEGPGVDKAGAQESVMILGQALAENSPRFQVTQAQLQLQGRSREFFLEPLAPRYVQEVCRQTQVDGITVLEAFDSDMALKRTDGVRVKDKDKGERKVPFVHMEMVMKVVSGFRTYGAAQGFILDQAKLEDYLTFSGEGATYQQALSQLPAPDICIRQVARLAGDKYARRIAPSYFTLTREYYTRAKKDIAMQQAAIRATSEDWAGAAALWQQATTHANPKVAGRAFYNMAVASEFGGNLDEAIAWARKSAYTANNRAAREYLRQLQRRQQAQLLIAEQLQSLPMSN